MEAVIKKWGNSLGIRIPILIAKSININDGSSVELKSTKDGILIIPKEKPILSEMLDKITDYNIHKEIETGYSVGNEIW
ncbi:MAG: AbrB/MazE/SpoVT family DNA-binding domain-containing protein [Termitinemataceae bacterium]|nr:multidrug transporter MatE [Spirochaetia bacterium]GMO36277.1 MAG: AbrB/MazE/SpoVT family DNA-binding domain-containing protein [Termitinemataceae bacterium]